MRDVLAKIISGQHLTREQARRTFDRIMAGDVDPTVLSGFLCALATKGESVDELVGAAQAMRDAATKVNCAKPSLDTCGTGGDGISTFNVSTTAAIIASAAGATVAKHGNRTNTRVSGSAEVLAELGVNIDATVPTLERCLEEIDIAFLYAPGLHPAMKHAGPVRKEIAVRTIFNLLGPLSNPANASFQVLGVSKPAYTELIATVLKELGTQTAWVVHGHDGICDLTISGPTTVVELRSGQLRNLTIKPGDVGLSEAPLSTLLVDSPSQSAQAVRDVLAGEKGPRRDHALLNAGAALVVCSKAKDLKDGVCMAAEAVDSGQALAKLQDLVRLSNE